MLAARRVVQFHSGTAIRAFASTATGKSAAAKTAKAENANNASGGFQPLAAHGAALLGAAAAGGVTAMEKKQKLPKQKYTSPAELPIQGKESHHGDYNDPPPRPDLPTFKLEDVAEHCDESSLWYTFRGAVYDLTVNDNDYIGVVDWIGFRVFFISHVYDLCTLVLYQWTPRRNSSKWMNASKLPP